LTGSSTPTVGGAHSGVGRIAPMVMRTMTLFESEESSGRVSLQRLFDGEEEVADIAPLDIEDIARILCRGGWPAAVTAGAASVPGRLARTYVEGLIDSDVARMDGVSRNSTRMRALMRAYARHVSTQASQTTIAADLAVNDGAMAPNTVSDYLDALSRAYVVEDLPAWNPVLRSKTAIRTSPTRHFVDPSIGAAVMRWTPADLLRDFEAFGLQFESLCVRDLRVYAEAIDGTLLHYRDKTGLEADAVIVLADGRWAPIEVKLGSRQLDEAATHLRLLRERVDANRMGEPSFLAVVTAGATAYRRDDGVLVVPLACLRP
ncbi:MAG: ATP-binding protein, partial [Arachnia propionica]